MKESKTKHETKTTSAQAGAGSTPSFEAAMQELSEIVETLEDGKAPLGDSLKMVQRGRELSELCAQMLGEAELTLAQLATTPDGELVEEPLDYEDEES